MEQKPSKLKFKSKHQEKEFFASFDRLADIGRSLRSVREDKDEAEANQEESPEGSAAALDQSQAIDG